MKKKKYQHTVFIMKKKFALEISLFHFSDARLEIINFLVQFSDTLVYRSLLGYGIIGRIGSEFYNECG
tara:strand:+ start:223 stop:426 length:204 start_codon:yes stop_codon:yes gene_type:complete